MPIIVVSARENAHDKIAALDGGADDYLTKPFSLGELLTRLRAVLRRAPLIDEGESPGLVVTVGGLCLDFERRFLVEGQQVHLTPIEYALLQ